LCRRDLRRGDRQDYRRQSTRWAGRPRRDASRDRSIIGADESGLLDDLRFRYFGDRS
jgi:hypothetical protein